MNSFKKWLINSLRGALLVTIALSTAYVVEGQSGQDPAANRPPTEVKVVNSPAEPVPVAGTVTVANLGTSALPVTGTVSIGNLASSPLPVRDIERSSRIPVQYTMDLNMPSGQSGKSETVAIPQGKMLVVEYVSANAQVYAGRILQVILHTPAPDATFKTFIHNFLGVQNGHDFTVSSQARMYAIGSLTMGISRDTTQDPLLAFGAITGYLTDAPVPN